MGKDSLVLISAYQHLQRPNLQEFLRNRCVNCACPYTVLLQSLSQSDLCHPKRTISCIIVLRGAYSVLKCIQKILPESKITLCTQLQYFFYFFFAFSKAGKLCKGFKTSPFLSLHKYHVETKRSVCSALTAEFKLQKNPLNITFL